VSGELPDATKPQTQGDTMNCQAIKAVYSRSLKTYIAEYHAEANPLYAHEGFLVFSDLDYIIAALEDGRVCQHWDAKKLACVKTYLLRLQEEITHEAALVAAVERANPNM